MSEDPRVTEDENDEPTESHQKMMGQGCCPVTARFLRVCGMRSRNPASPCLRRVPLVEEIPHSPIEAGWGNLVCGSGTPNITKQMRQMPASSRVKVRRVIQEITDLKCFYFWEREREEKHKWRRWRRGRERERRMF
uniref:Uncharacterized protein n=1 Tax=Suricata suricatta TaxID=37032 RepID=A0A673V023_SURSU